MNRQLHHERRNTMKKQLETIFLSLRSALLATLTLAIIFGPTTSMAAINTANWDIAGVGQVASSITINSYAGGSVTLTKAAFLAADGTPLPNLSSVPTNTPIQFMLYVRNTNSFAMNNINISDYIDPALFTMDPSGTPFQIDASESDVATETAIYTAVSGAGTSTANQDADVASYDINAADTINVGSTNGDGPLNIPANTTWAILFTVTIL
jgi:hypothetical protein